MTKHEKILWAVTGVAYITMTLYYINKLIKENRNLQTKLVKIESQVFGTENNENTDL